MVKKDRLDEFCVWYLYCKNHTIQCVFDRRTQIFVPQGFVFHQKDDK